MDKVYINVKDTSKWIAERFEGKDLVSIDDVLDCMQDIIDENENLKEELHDLKVDMEENYQLKEIDLYDYYGVSKED